MRPLAKPYPSNGLPRAADLLAAHKHSIRHRAEILVSQRCGCFHCLGVYAPGEISRWTDWPETTPPARLEREGDTALCPRCGIDAVIGDASGFPIEAPFLSAMQTRWFGCD
ncbi:hypothetical protein [Chitinimonas sp.]|uniref:hypothetical protein n=1 Tax=Chitinimonas sp. TaxID=1934313 RepID=UPI002F94A5A3